jgi:phage baseplate assembly protein W
MPNYARPVVGDENWCGSISVPGRVLEGLDCVRQRVLLAIYTPVGSDPLRPYFGTSLRAYADRPMTEAAALIKKEIAEAVAQWVPEVTLNKITFKTEYGVARFALSMSYGGVPFAMDLGNLPAGGNIFTMRLPYNDPTAGTPYVRMSLHVGGTLYGPITGFSDLDAMTDYMNHPEVWGRFGLFTHGRDTIILFAEGAATSVFMTCTLSATP